MPTPPPRVDCEQGQGEELAALPDCGDMGAQECEEAELLWVASVLAWGEGEALKRRATDRCLAVLRERGVIR